MLTPAALEVGSGWPLLAHGDLDVREAAVQAVGALGAAAATPDFLARLAAPLADGDWHVRSSAAEANGCAGRRGRHAGDPGPAGRAAGERGFKRAAGSSVGRACARRCGRHAGDPGPPGRPAGGRRRARAVVSSGGRGCARRAAAATPAILARRAARLADEDVGAARVGGSADRGWTRPGRRDAGDPGLAGRAGWRTRIQTCGGQQREPWVRSALRPPTCRRSWPAWPSCWRTYSCGGRQRRPWVGSALRPPRRLILARLAELLTDGDRGCAAGGSAGRGWDRRSGRHACDSGSPGRVAGGLPGGRGLGRAVGGSAGCEWDRRSSCHACDSGSPGRVAGGLPGGRGLGTHSWRQQ